MKVLQTITAVKDGASFSSKEEGLSQLLTDCKAGDDDPSYYDDSSNILQRYKTIALTPSEEGSDTLTITVEYADVATYLRDVQTREAHQENNGGSKSFGDSIGWAFAEDIEPIDE
jgi:hypothetical protein